ncbi:hypothetical protein CAOG_02627 [Capsaspora owczarzaki ATCC 30864]|nr:hypothetical protein CAOG_02627 [Capsaspora owczarzaki ATCC 30864]|eukprot:XP_004349377.2 hypothetical protein CAOG_02627 [Capsaspora owczarzaki ATCC 30864]
MNPTLQDTQGGVATRLRSSALLQSSGSRRARPINAIRQVTVSRASARNRTRPSLLLVIAMGLTVASVVLAAMDPARTSAIAFGLLATGRPPASLWWCGLLAMAVMAWAVIFWLASTTVHQETITVVPGLGIELTVVKGLRRRSTTTFLDAAQVRDVVINEVITMHRVISVLVVLASTHDAASGSVERVVPVFRHLHPRLAELRPIAKALRKWCELT